MKHYSMDKYFDPVSRSLVGKYTEKYGFDGGDTMQRTGMYYMGCYYRGRRYMNPHKMGFFVDAMSSLEVESGKYVRYPFTKKWESDLDRMSRDQLIPVICSLGALGLKDFLKRMFKAHLKRGLLFTTNTRRNGTTKKNHGKQYKAGASKLIKFQKFVLKYKIPFFSVPGYRNYNWKLPDFTLFTIWAMYIRGFNLKILYPLLYIFDLELLVNSILKRTLVKDDIDIVNHVIQSVYFHKRMPTLISKLANKVNNPEDMKRRMDAYFSDQDEPFFINDVYKPLIDEVMG